MAGRAYSAASAQDAHASRLRHPEPRTSRGRRACAGWRALARHRRRGQRQDADTGVPPGPFGAVGGRSTARAAAHLLTPCRCRDGAPCRAAVAPGTGPARQHRAAHPALVRHLPQHRRALAARRGAACRPGAGFHRARPRRCAGPAGPHAAVAGPGSWRERTGQALPPGAHLPGHPLALRQHAPAAGRAAAVAMALVLFPRRRSAIPVHRLRPGQAAAAVARLRRPAAGLVAPDAGAGPGAAHCRALRACAGRRSAGHQPPAGRHPACPGAAGVHAHGGRRRRTVDLRLPRCRRAPHPRLPATLRPTGPRRHPATELPQHAAAAAGLQRRHRAGGRALHQGTVDGARRRLPAPAGDGARRSSTGPRRGRRGARSTRDRPGPETPGGALSHLAPQRRVRDGTGAPRGALRQVRRPEVHGGRAREGRAGRAALGRQPGLAPGRLARRAAGARHGPGQRAPRA